MRSNPKLAENDDLIETCVLDTKTRWKTPDDITIETYCWPQTWGSTALGFGGMGGASMTMATTILIKCQDLKRFGVYFNDRHAYDVKMESDRSDVFAADIARKFLTSVREAKTKYRLLHDPSVVVSLRYLRIGDKTNFDSEFTVKFHEALVLVPIVTQESVVFERADIGLRAEFPWNNETWDPEIVAHDLSGLITTQWKKYVLTEKDNDIAKNLNAMTYVEPYHMERFENAKKAAQNGKKRRTG